KLDPVLQIHGRAASPAGSIGPQLFSHPPGGLADLLGGGRRVRYVPARCAVRLLLLRFAATDTLLECFALSHRRNLPHDHVPGPPTGRDVSWKIPTTRS